MVLELLGYHSYTTKGEVLLDFSNVICPIHVVTFTLISNLATDYIQKRTGQALLFSFEYNLSPNVISM